MGLHNLFGGGQRPPQGQQKDPMQIARQLGQNTSGMMQSVGLNIPASMNGNGMDAMNHLLKSGQINQQQYDQAMQFARKLLGGR